METTLGTRIRYFRENKGLGSAELAELIGLSASAMSLVESGSRQVKAEELAKIAEALEISPLAILESDSLVANLSVAARNSEPSGSPQGALLGRLNFFAEISDLVGEYDVRPPRPEDMPSIEIEREWLASARNLAKWARSHLGDWTDGGSHFVQLRNAIENSLFIDVVVDEGSESDVLGAAITDRRLPLLIVNANQRRQRALFTLAHELGHVLVGGTATIITDEDLAASNASERFANAFAAELLLPETMIRETLIYETKVPDALANMLVKSGVSWQTLIYRLHNLRLVTASGRDALLSLGLRGILYQVSLEEIRTTLELEELRVDLSPIPHWLAESSISAYKSGVISIRPLASMAKMDPNDLLDAISKPLPIVVNASDLAKDPKSSEGSETDEELFAGIPA